MKRKIVSGLIALLILSIANTTHAQVYVEKGDTFYKIAKRNEMTLADLISLNPHIKNPNRIKPGDYIVIRSEVETQKDLVDYARSLQETTKYVYGGQNAPYETDCSGWTQHLYKKFGVVIPRTSAQQATAPGGKTITFRDLQIGDLMFFSTRADKKITHTGVYMGNDYWISNLNEAKDVEILSSWGNWTQAYFQWGARYEF